MGEEGAVANGLGGIGSGERALDAERVLALSEADAGDVQGELDAQRLGGIVGRGTEERTSAGVPAEGLAIAAGALADDAGAARHASQGGDAGVRRRGVDLAREAPGAGVGVQRLVVLTGELGHVAQGLRH